MKSIFITILTVCFLTAIWSHSAYAADPTEIHGTVRTVIRGDQVKAVVISTGDRDVPVFLNHKGMELARYAGQTVRVRGVWRSIRGNISFVVINFTIETSASLQDSQTADILLETRKAANHEIKTGSLSALRCDS